MNLKLILLIVTLASIYSIPSEAEDLFSETCHMRTNENDWKLIWNDEFDDPKSGYSKLDTEKNWTLDNEIEGKSCHGNFINQVSCNVARNAVQTGGALFLLAAREKFGDQNYTAAQITTREAIITGRPGIRVEIRAAQPLRSGYLRTSIHTVSRDATYWHQLGQVDVASTTDFERSLIVRGVHFANSTREYQSMDAKIKDNNNSFHLYGFEWFSTRAGSGGELRFFIDKDFSAPIKFDPTGSRSFPSTPHHLRLQIGVGGMFFDPPIPSSDDQPELNWTLPALIVDYVRVYRNISGEIQDPNLKLRDCKFAENDSTRDLTQQALIELYQKAAMIAATSSSSASSSLTLSFVCSKQLALILIFLILQLRYEP